MSKIKILESDKSKIDVNDNELFFLWDYMKQNNKNYIQHFMTFEDLFNKYFSVVFRFNELDGKEYKLTDFLNYFQLMVKNNIQLDAMEYQIDIYFKDYILYSVNEDFAEKFKNEEIQGYVVTMIRTILFLKNETDILKLKEEKNEYIFEKYLYNFNYQLNEIHYYMDDSIDNLESLDYKLKTLQKGLKNVTKFLEDPETHEVFDMYDFAPDNKNISMKSLQKIIEIENAYDNLVNIINNNERFKIFEELKHRFERIFFREEGSPYFESMIYQVYLQVKQILPDFEFNRDFTEEEKTLLDMNKVLFNTVDIYNKMKK